MPFGRPAYLPVEGDHLATKVQADSVAFETDAAKARPGPAGWPIALLFTLGGGLLGASGIPSMHVVRLATGGVLFALGLAMLVGLARGPRGRPRVKMTVSPPGVIVERWHRGKHDVVRVPAADIVGMHLRRDAHVGDWDRGRRRVEKVEYRLLMDRRDGRPWPLIVSTKAELLRPMAQAAQRYFPDRRPPPTGPGALETIVDIADQIAHGSARRRTRIPPGPTPQRGDGRSTSGPPPPARSTLANRSPSSVRSNKR